MLNVNISKSQISFKANDKTKDELITKTAEYAKAKLSGEASGHDWWHVYRVWNNSKNILKTEPQADYYTVELASILHDIADWKFHNGDTTIGPNVARKFLKSINFVITF